MIRNCGCTYRDDGSVIIGEWDALEHWVRDVLCHEPRSWGELCNLLRCNTDTKRDALHRILHQIAEPTVTPEEGPGRRGTLWRLIPND